MQSSEPPFEKELETSPVYRRAAFNRLRASKSSSNAASEPSFLSGLSLSDVSNVTAMALPISCRELWNHHRYATPQGSRTTREVSTLDAWYNPPPKVSCQVYVGKHWLTRSKKSAFIRTVYFDGQYTNQYAQAKFTGHLIYRRFDITGPDGSPRFKEGLAILSSSDQNKVCYGEEIERGHRLELDGTGPYEIEGHCMEQDGKDRARGPERRHLLASCWSLDSSVSWGQEVLQLLGSVGF